jgi:hypothetical protein
MPKFLFVNRFFCYRLEPMIVDFGSKIPIWHLKAFETDQLPTGQYVTKNNSTWRVGNGKEWERTGKLQYLFGGCNFRKGKYLAFCREILEWTTTVVMFAAAVALVLTWGD